MTDLEKHLDKAERVLSDLQNQWAREGREVEKALRIRMLEQRAAIVREKLLLLGVKPVA